MAHQALDLVTQVKDELVESRSRLRVAQDKIAREILALRNEEALSKESREKLAMILEEDNLVCSDKINLVSDLILALQDVSDEIAKGKAGCCARRVIKVVAGHIPQLKHEPLNALVGKLETAHDSISA